MESRSGAQWERPRTPAERVAELNESERLVKRDIRRTLGIAAMWWILALSAGLNLMAWSIHTTDTRWAGAAFWGGLVVGYGGLTVTFAWIYRRGQEHGWW